MNTTKDCDRAMNGKRITTIALTPILLMGCANANKNLEVWKPQPIVQWEDVSTRSIIPVRQGYQIQLPMPTRGFFPLSMGVTRVTIQQGDMDYPPANTTRALVTDPRNEFLRWNQSLDDLMAISEVFPVTMRDLGGGPTHPEQILAAFSGLHAGMGLVYAVNELSRHKIEMFGVLYDAKNERPIASLHTQAESEPSLIGAGKHEAVDLWVNDGRAKVREQFEQLLHACIYELIHQDQLEMIALPEPLITDRPVRLVDWPAHHLKTKP